METIGSNAFSGCDALTQLTFSDSVKSLGDAAFSGCTALTEVTIPAGVETIGAGAFRSCTALTAFHVASGNVRFADDDGILLSKGKTELILYPSGKTDTDVVIPRSVKTVRASAFSGCPNLVRVIVSNGVEDIGNSAFASCAALEEVSLPETLRTLGNSAFQNCAALTGVTIPGGVAVIESLAFNACKALTTANIGNGVTEIGGSAFAGCAALTGVTLPASLEKIGSYAFSGCKALERVTIPGGVTTVESYAFQSCTGLTAANMPDSVTKIGDHAFSNCMGLTAVVVPAGVETIGDYAFYCCENLSSIVLPDGLKSMGSYVFQYCYNLESIVIPDSVTSVGGAAFSSCISLNAVTLSKGMTLLNGSLFYDCGRLSAVTIPDGVTKIEVGAFHNCTGLQKIAIPSSVTTLVSYPFTNCVRLTDVYYGGSAADFSKIAGAFPEGVTLHENDYENGAKLCVPKSPVIALTNVPPYGSGENFSGIVFREDGGEVNASAYRVTLYVQPAEGSECFVKPSSEQTFVPVEPGGRFTVWYTSGGVSDTQALRVHLFLFPASYTPTGDFETDKAAALDSVLVTRTAEGGVTVDPAREAVGAAAPRIKLTYTPAYRESAQFSGVVYRPDGKKLEGSYRIALYLQVSLGNTMYPKPYYNHPYADVSQEDGSFHISYNTGGIDLTAKVLNFMLIPGDYTPLGSTSSDSYNGTRAVALDYVHVSRTEEGGVTVTPSRVLPYDDNDPGKPSGLKPAADKIAVDVGFYTDGSAPGSPLSAELIRAHLQAASRFADTVRFYSASGEVYKAYEIAHAMGLTVLGGAWLAKENTPADIAANKAELDALIEHCNKGYVKAAIVGSECLLRGDFEAAKIIEYMDYVRKGLNNKDIPVTTADSVDILRDNRTLRRACDFLMPNCYPYWSKVKVDNAGTAFGIALDSLRSVSGGKEIVVSETGWPVAGETQGEAVAGGEQAATYFKALRAWSLEHETQVFFFESADEAWKQTDEGVAGANWGFMDSSFKVKDCYQPLEPFSGAPLGRDAYAVEYSGGTTSSSAVSLTNDSGAAANVFFCVAAYDAQGKMVVCQMKSKALGVAESVTVSVSYAGKAVTETRAFVLDADTLSPLREAWSRRAA